MLTTAQYVAHVVQPAILIFIIFAVASLPLLISFWGRALRNLHTMIKEARVERIKEREAYRQFRETYFGEGDTNG